MYAAGAQRQVISVLSHLGLGESYTTLIAKTSKPRAPITPDSPMAETALSIPIPAPIASSSDVSEEDDPPVTLSPPKKPAPRRAGTLRTLSFNMRALARTVASTGLFASIYDNINMVFRAAEQIMSRSGQ